MRRYEIYFEHFVCILKQTVVPQNRDRIDQRNNYELEIKLIIVITLYPGISHDCIILRENLQNHYIIHDHIIHSFLKHFI